MALAYLDARYLIVHRHIMHDLNCYRYILMRLVWQYISEPSHDCYDRDCAAEHSKPWAHDQRCKDQDQSQGHQKRPRRRCRQVHNTRRRAHTWIGMWNLSHRPIQYTTVKTTIQTASTKCQ